MSLLVSLGHLAAALLFGALAVLLLTSWRGRLQGGLLTLAVLGSALWAGLFAVQAGYRILPSSLIWAAEAARDLGWVVFLGRVLTLTLDRQRAYARVISALRYGVTGLCLVLLIPFDRDPLFDMPLQGWLHVQDLRFLGQLVVAVAGLAFVEQLYRNAPQEQRWGLKHMCIGLGAMFAYDLALYADAVLFNRLDSDLWNARGAVNALIVPFVAVSASRNPQWSVSPFVSRQAVFHTTAVVGAGTYLLAMALAGYYIQAQGGEWGGVLRTVFLFAAGLVLLALLFSGQVRTRLKLFLIKHFHRSRFDYRDEWLRLVRTLTGKDTEAHLFERVIRALAEIVESPAGLLWLCHGRVCNAVAGWNRAVPTGHGSALPGGLAESLRASEWIVNLSDLQDDPAIKDEVPWPAWVCEIEEAWLIVPLLHEDSLQGFVVLTRPRARVSLNWEALDLIKTAARQAASYLAQYRAAKALSEARQFEGFNRLSAYVIHDLKNLIAQLSLVAKNASRHRDNPAFFDDAIKTVENAVTKMSRLMAQLRSASRGEELPVELGRMLRGAVRERSGQSPVPVLICVDEPVWVRCEADRLAAVLGHVVQNAQDATPPDGSVRVELRCAAAEAIVEVRDTGQGMDEAFIRERLFQPFYSTKGLTGMGIGAYECRDFVQSAGGSVEVVSAPGEGTGFTIRLPLLESTSRAAAMPPGARNIEP